MPISNYLASVNLIYAGAAIGTLVIIFMAFLIFRYFRRIQEEKQSGGWSRIQEEEEELGEDEIITKSTKEVLKLQLQEKQGLNQLIKEYTSLLDQFSLLLSSVQLKESRRTATSTSSLSHEEIKKILQTILSILGNIKKENTPIKNDESMFDKVVSYWNIVYREMGAWTYVPNQRQVGNYNKSSKKIMEISTRINDKIVELGIEMKQEEELDERKKQEILRLYQEVVREEGKSV